MSALFILIGISIVVAGSFLTAFLWSVGDGQYDDDYTPSVRMLFDDSIKKETTIIATEPLNKITNRDAGRNILRRNKTIKCTQSKNTGRAFLLR